MLTTWQPKTKSRSKRPFNSNLLIVDQADSKGASTQPDICKNKHLVLYLINTSANEIQIACVFALQALIFLEAP
jgi:hypothetical protein